MKKPIVTTISLCLGLLVGLLSVPAFANSNSRFPTNSNGQTYGSAALAETAEEEPDLILAQGIDGTQGYVKSADLNGDMPKSPEEALVKQRANALRYRNGERMIPLYASDGKTVIGKFRISTGSTIETLPDGTKREMN